MIDGILDLLKDWAEWLWCWLMNKVYDLFDLVLEALFFFLPDLSENITYVNSMNQLWTWFTALQHYFPLAEFVIAFTTVKTVEVAVWAYHQIIVLVPGAGR